MAQQQRAYVRMQGPVASVTQPQTVQRRGYKSSAGRSTGGIQISCGALAIALGISEIVFSYDYFGIGWPIWGGVLYVVAGSLGVSTKKGRNCLIIAYMVISIISATFAADQLIWASIGASISNCYYCYENKVAYGLHVAFLLITAFEMLAAIIGSAFCCHGVCWTINQTTPFLVQYNPQMQQQTGQIYLQQQVAPAQYQPPPGAPMQNQPIGAPMQYQSPAVPAHYQSPAVAHSQYPQGAQAQYSPQGATDHYPGQGAPPVYNERESSPGETRLETSEIK